MPPTLCNRTTPPSSDQRNISSSLFSLRQYKAKTAKHTKTVVENDIRLVLYTIISRVPQFCRNYQRRISHYFLALNTIHYSFLRFTFFFLFDNFKYQYLFNFLIQIKCVFLCFCKLYYFNKIKITRIFLTKCTV